MPYRSVNDGVKHACGHDAHTAIVLGVAEVLAGLKARLPGTVVFVFQPAEEGPPEGEEGGAPLMVKEGVLDAPKIGAMFGLHVDPALPAGEVGWTTGPIFASSDTFAVEVRGKKTHGAYPHTGLDPIPVAAEIVQALQLVVSRQIDARSPKVLTIGSIHGGNRLNIIADTVELRGHDPHPRRRRAHATSRSAWRARWPAWPRPTASPRRCGSSGEGNPPTVNEPALTRASVPSLERVYGAARVTEVEPQMGAEDFAQFAERVPALYVKLGVRNEARGITAMIHTEDFDLDEAMLPLGRARDGDRGVGPPGPRRRSPGR